MYYLTLKVLNVKLKKTVIDKNFRLQDLKFDVKPPHKETLENAPIPVTNMLVMIFES